jgi:hypothetical protein
MPAPPEVATRAINYLRRSRVQLGLARAAATAPIRDLRAASPDSWEFSAFSAGGEDGIIDFLTRHMSDPELSFIEIGASDGLANNTAWLAIARKWQGLMVEADAKAVARARAIYDWFNPLVKVLELWVDERNAARVLEAAGTSRPDVFSLDIDGADYYVARTLFDAGLRPRVCVVEYNSAFGPELSCTIDPSAHKSTHERLYYGVSIRGWRNFFAGHGYRFLGVERTGVNAFFVDPASFPSELLQAVRGREFAENVVQRQQQAADWPGQLERVRLLGLVEILAPK